MPWKNAFFFEYIFVWVLYTPDIRDMGLITLYQDLLRLTIANSKGNVVKVIY